VDVPRAVRIDAQRLDANNGLRSLVLDAERIGVVDGREPVQP
jgi:hypothetical protein